MREQYWEFYPPSSQKLEELNRDGLVVLDSNALLHAYRLPPQASKAWLDMLEVLDNRLWIPHQAGLEYQRNRISVAQSQNDLIREVEKQVSGSFSDLRKALEAKRSRINRSRAVNWPQVEKALGRSKDPLAELASEAIANDLNMSEVAKSIDEIHERLSELFSSRVGPKPTDEWITSAHAESQRRIEEKEPPGFEDDTKGDDRKHGDTMIWLQILDHAKEEKRPVVFVTEERKQDWIRREAGLNIGPLPALRKEFEEEVGKPFWLYSVYGFMTNAGNFDVNISSAALEEAAVVDEELTGDTDRVPHINYTERFLREIDRFTDTKEISDDELRAEILRILADWLVLEMSVSNEQLSGPGTAPKRS